MSDSKTNVVDFMGELGAGNFITKLAYILSEAAQSQLLYGQGNKKSKIDLSFSFQQMGDNDQVIISHKLSKCLPTNRGKKMEEDTTETVFFVGKQGVMTIEPPKEDDSGQFNLQQVK